MQEPATTTSSPELDDALAPVAWLAGDWHATQGTQRRHWVAAGGTLYGVAFEGADWSVQIIDDGDGEAATRRRSRMPTASSTPIPRPRRSRAG